MRPLIKHPQELTYRHGVPFVLWCYWEGEAMQGNRKLSFDYLQEHIGVPIALVGPENIAAFILADHPLHQAFPCLSIVHRSDYIRAYLLHFYGGAWHDIKATEVSFADCWEQFQAPNLFLIGRPELPKGAAAVQLSPGRYIGDHWQDLVAVPAWIGRPQTPLSRDIYRELIQLLDDNLAALQKYPARHAREKKIHRKNIFQELFVQIKCLCTGRNPNYPLDWTVFGNIFHPAVYRYRDHIARNLPTDQAKNAGIYHRG